MNISASYYSAMGGRENNEDAVSLSESSENVIAMVADGLGGHANGELASKLAVKVINMEISHQEVSAQTLRSAVEKANERIIEDSKGSSMKSTVSVVWFDEKNALAANVGDTRIYQFRNRKIMYQSVDHSAAQMAYMAGDISKEEIRTSRDRHKLIRALGGQERVRPDISSLELEKGDAVLLCSDGFWEKIKEEEMIEDLKDTVDAGNWLSKMKQRIEAGSDLQKGDNHSAVAIILL